MSARPAWQTHAAAFRGALWITLIAFVTTSVALTVQYVQTTRLVEAQMRGLLENEASSLVERYETGGILNLAGFLRQRQETPRINEFFYVLAAPDGTPIAGNLARWPSEVDRAGFHRFPTMVIFANGAVRPRSVETLTSLLDGDYRLLVGHFAEQRTVLRDRYRSALFWSLMFTGILGLALGWWYSRRGLAFVEEVSATGERFLAGSLEQRVPVSGRGDEYDRLAGTINACFTEIEHVVRSLRAATDGLAHDLKTPLTRINARLELAEMHEPSSDEMHQTIAESRADLAGLLRIINETLSLARAEATTSSSFVDVDLTALAADVIDLYAPVAEDRGILLERRLDPARLSGAPALISQLLINLVDNAIKYAPEGGAVKVDVRSNSEAVTLSVSDNGPGIPPERRSDVLSRFVRLDESRSMPGVGIGLSIVSAVARVHRASLHLDDNDPGLRIVVNFPVERTMTG